MRRTGQGRCDTNFSEEDSAKPDVCRMAQLEVFAVSLKDHFRQYVTLPAIWRHREAVFIWCVPSFSEFAYHSGVFRDEAKRFGCLLLGTSMKELTIIFVVCSNQVADHGAAKFFQRA